MYEFNSADWRKKTNLISQLVSQGEHVMLKKYDVKLGVLIPYHEFVEYLKLRGLELKDLEVTEENT